MGAQRARGHRFGSATLAQVSSSLAVISGASWWERMGAAFLVTTLKASSAQDLDPADAAACHWVSGSGDWQMTSCCIWSEADSLVSRLPTWPRPAPGVSRSATSST
jgi:hypothetical protein